MNKEKFDTKLKEKFPDENYSVLYYGKNSYENSVLKCLDCGRRIEVNTGELFRSRRRHICSKCHYKRKGTQLNENVIRERLLVNGHTDIHFFMQNRNGIRHNNVHFKCGKCGKINEKETANFLREIYDCSYCEGVKRNKDTDIFMKEMYELYGDKFELVSEYNSVNESIIIKCSKCGFKRKVKPAAFLQNGYCPKCGKIKSKGEQKITNYLQKNNIDFETQKYFSEWGIGIHYFDFYIPEFNLVIEFNGKQHYKYNNFFHRSEENFLKEKDKDLKKERDRNRTWIKLCINQLYGLGYKYYFIFFI